MKKILILFTVLFSFCLSAFAEYKPIPKESYINIVTSIDNYELFPKDLIYKYIKIIPNNELEQYKIDMNNALQHILYDKITYEKNTLMQMLIDFDKESTKIYKKYLKNKTNKEQNKIYIQKLKEMQGTISLYPEAIIEELKNVINKYDLNLTPGAECDILVYKYYIEKYNIALAQEFKTLLTIKQFVYLNINNYILEISDKI
ncbi:MAG: hypothetical protein VZR09_07695 [Candidatus Gastranaerophilaceae bacterium]|nr:hypothetical protein [Candidatus Gastranaerophilaceae bacterium]